MGKTLQKQLDILKEKFKCKLKVSYIQKLQNSFNKNINVIISDRHNKADFDLFGFGSEVLVYPSGTKIGRILIDTGLAKSWSEVKGSHWNTYEIPWGFTDLELDGLSVYKHEGFGRRPHRLSILQWEDPVEEDSKNTLCTNAK